MKHFRTVLIALLVLSPATSFAETIVGNKVFDACGGSTAKTENPKLYDACKEKEKSDAMYDSMWADGQCGGNAAYTKNPAKFQKCRDAALMKLSDQRYARRGMDCVATVDGMYVTCNGQLYKKDNGTSFSGIEKSLETTPTTSDTQNPSNSKVGSPK